MFPVHQLRSSHCERRAGGRQAWNRNRDSERQRSTMMFHTRLHARLDVAIMLGALATISLTVLQEHGIRSAALNTMDWAVWSVFAIEFLFIVSFGPRVQIV
jgi:hypothetical protein